MRSAHLESIDELKVKAHNYLDEVCNRHRIKKKVVYWMLCRKMNHQKCHFAQCETSDDIQNLLQQLKSLDKYLSDKKYVKVDPEAIRKVAMENEMRKLSTMQKLWYRIKRVL